MGHVRVDAERNRQPSVSRPGGAYTPFLVCNGVWELVEGVARMKKWWPFRDAMTDFAEPRPARWQGGYCAATAESGDPGLADEATRSGFRVSGDAPERAQR